jgi:ketosteroid isomerase-like protein
MTDEQAAKILEAVRQASQRWQQAFNDGDAARCAKEYEKTAIMHARPFGTFTGTSAIQAFWQKLIDDGFSNVAYIDPQIKVIDKNCAILTSGWKMNKAQGVIHNELWILQSDGKAKLREDDFEAI